MRTGKGAELCHGHRIHQGMTQCPGPATAPYRFGTTHYLAIATAKILMLESVVRVRTTHARKVFRSIHICSRRPGQQYRLHHKFAHYCTALLQPAATTKHCANNEQCSLLHLLEQALCQEAHACMMKGVSSPGSHSLHYKYPECKV